MSDVSGSEEEDEFPQFGWQRFDDDRPAPIKFHSSHAATVSDQKTIERRSRKKLWAASVAAIAHASSSDVLGGKKAVTATGSGGQRLARKSASSKKWGPLAYQKQHGSSSSDEQEPKETLAEWKPLKPQASVSKSYGDQELAVMPGEDEEETTHKKRASKIHTKLGDAFRKRGSMLMHDLKKKKMIESAAANTHSFLIFTKSQNCIQKMQTTLDRHQELTSSARYRALMDQLQTPEKALIPLARLCDVDSAGSFARLEHIMVPIVQDSKKRYYEAKDIQNDEDACNLQEAQLRQASQVENEIHARYKSTLLKGADQLEQAVNDGSHEYTKIAKEICSMRREHKTRRIAFDEYNKEMAVLRKRELHASGIIEGVESRQRAIEEKQRSKIQELQTQLHASKRKCAQIFYQCEEKMNNSKSVMSRIEAKLEDRLLKHAQKMLFMRLQRQTREKSFQERSLELRKEKLLKETKRLRIASTKAENNLNRAKAINQVLELRQRALEGEALLMELELRCREVKPKGLGIEPADKGFFTLLVRELERQTQWHVNRAQPWEFDRSTLKLTRQPPLASPLVLLRCARKLVWEWRQQEERAMEIECARLRNIELDKKKKQEMLERSRKGSPEGAFDAEELEKLTGTSPPQTPVPSGSPTEGQPNASRSSIVIRSHREDPYKAVLALHTSVNPLDHEFEQAAFKAAKQVFERNVNDLILEAVLKRGQLEQKSSIDDPICPRFLKEMSCLPSTLGKVQSISDRWEELKGSVQCDDAPEELQPRLDELIADLLDARDMALACAHWVTEGARIPGVFSDVLVMELSWLPRFCNSLSQRIGALRGIVTMLETGSKNPKKYKKVAMATMQLVRSLKFLSNMQMLQLAEDWMLRIIRILHDQLQLHLSCNSALRWYCGKFYGQGGTDLAAISRGLDVLQRLMNAPQLQKSGASERLLAGEVSAEVRKGLTKALRKNDAQAYESALLAFNVLEQCTCEEPIGTDFPVGKGIGWDDVEESPYCKRMSQVSAQYDFRGSIPRIHFPGEADYEHAQTILETDSAFSSDSEEELSSPRSKTRSLVLSPVAAVISEEVALDQFTDSHHSDDHASEHTPSRISVREGVPSRTSVREGSMHTVSPPMSPSSLRDGRTSSTGTLERPDTRRSETAVESPSLPELVSEDEEVPRESDKKPSIYMSPVEGEESKPPSRSPSPSAKSARSDVTSQSEGSKTSRISKPSKRTSRSLRRKGTTRSLRSHRSSCSEGKQSQAAFSTHSSQAASTPFGSESHDGKVEAEEEGLSIREIARAALFDLFSRAASITPSLQQRKSLRTDSSVLFSSSSDSENEPLDEHHQDDSNHEVNHEAPIYPPTSPKPSKRQIEQHADPGIDLGLSISINGHGSNEPGHPIHHGGQQPKKRSSTTYAAIAKHNQSRSPAVLARQEAIKERRRSEKRHLLHHAMNIGSRVAGPKLVVEGMHARTPSPIERIKTHGSDLVSSRSGTKPTAADRDHKPDTRNMGKGHHPEQSKDRRPKTPTDLEEKTHSDIGDADSDSDENESETRESSSRNRSRGISRQSRKRRPNGTWVPTAGRTTVSPASLNPSPSNLSVRYSPDSDQEDVLGMIDTKSRRHILSSLQEWVKTGELSEMPYASKIKAWFEDALADQLKTRQPDRISLTPFSGRPERLSETPHSEHTVIEPALSNHVLDAYREKDSNSNPHVEDAILLAQMMKATEIQPLMADPLLNDLRDGSDLSSKSDDLPSVTSPRQVSVRMMSPQQKIEPVPPAAAFTAIPMLRNRDAPQREAKARQSQENNDLVTVGSNGLAVVAENPTASAEEWLEKIEKNQGSTASMRWLDRMRTEHIDPHPNSASKPNSRSSIVDGPDLLRLPGLQICLFERGEKVANPLLQPKHSLQVRLAKKYGGVANPVSSATSSQYLPHSDCSFARDEMDRFPKAQETEVSAVLQNGLVCGSPYTKVPGLGAEFCTGQDSALPGQVLKNSPSLFQKPINKRRRQRYGLELEQHRQTSPAKEAVPRRRRQLYDSPLNNKC